MCQTVISVLWTSTMQPWAAQSEKKHTAKKLWNSNAASSYIKTQHPNKTIFLIRNSLCLSSLWMSQDDATLSPRRTGWVPGGAGWSLRRFGDTHCHVTTARVFFCENWITVQEWSGCPHLDKDHRQTIFWHLLRSFPKGKVSLGMVWRQDVAQSLFVRLWLL